MPCETGTSSECLTWFFPSTDRTAKSCLGTAILLALGIGIRQTYGPFLANNKELTVTAADCTFALSVQTSAQALIPYGRRSIWSAYHDGHRRSDLRSWTGEFSFAERGRSSWP